jgi:hypothetical protein
MTARLTRLREERKEEKGQLRHERERRSVKYDALTAITTIECKNVEMYPASEVLWLKIWKGTVGCLTNDLSTHKKTAIPTMPRMRGTRTL